MMKVWMLLFLTFSLNALSSEFNHIKLSPEFEQYLTQSASKSNPSRQLKKKMGQNPLKSKMLNLLLNTSEEKTKTNFPIDGEESPLYEEIRRHLEASHEDIGLSEVQTINTLNQQFNLGSSNYSGFSWQKPFGVVQVHADRQVTPNIFGQDWLIMDTFTFEIEATTFLDKLNEGGLTKMSPQELGAFAGITFKRVYTYWHYAKSYQEGLSADFSKLFLPFLKFKTSYMETMGLEEIMKREDTWTAAAGGLISTPPLYNISFSAGILAEYDYQNAISIQKGPVEGQNIKLSVLSKKTSSVGASLELQLDFFKLINLSLLRYDMNYEYAAGKEFTLGFTTDQWKRLKEFPEQGDELNSILRGFGKINTLGPYISRFDESSSSSFEQKGNILIWGKIQKQKTEQVKVIKDENVRVFYKNNSQIVKVVQNIFSRIFSAVVYKILKLPLGVNDAAIYSRQINLEFEATHPQSMNPGIERVNSTEDFSLDINQYYNANKTDRWIDRKFKNDLIWFVDNFTTLPKSYKTDLRNEVIKGPMIIESHMRVEKSGFLYLIEGPESEVFSNFVNVCKSSKKDEWISDSLRKEMLQEEQINRDACVKDLGSSFLLFKDDYRQNDLRPSLAKFKIFIKKYYKKATGLKDLDALFGESNTFIHGRLEAQTSSGLSFKTTFSSGQFRGLGVIDNFKRTTGSRTPASIISE
jgi:hypothetical protein